MAMINMAANLSSAAIFFSTSGGMGLDGAWFWRASVRSAAMCVTASVGDRIGNLFCTGNSSVVLETRSYAVLGMYDVRHR